MTNVRPRTIDLALGAVAKSEGPLDRWSVRILEGPERGFRLMLPMCEPIGIGRAEGDGVVLTDSAVSREHATVRVKDGAVQVRDAGSGGGTLLGSARLAPRRWAIWKKDVALRVGKTVLVCIPPAIETIAEQIENAPLPPSEKKPALEVSAPEPEPPPPPAEAALANPEPRGTAAVVQVPAPVPIKRSTLSVVPFVLLGFVLAAALGVLVWIFR